ncbi:unnamed protein product [Sphagnum jensenii]|uniref:Uncharacterized protein n=1 Tax=Sphagnum jensenii TaxID=128206 RepID=A0ABP1BAN7_9BRYO
MVVVGVVEVRYNPGQVSKGQVDQPCERCFDFYPELRSCRGGGCGGATQRSRGGRGGKGGGGGGGDVVVEQFVISSVDNPWQVAATKMDALPTRLAIDRERFTHGVCMLDNRNGIF